MKKCLLPVTTFCLAISSFANAENLDQFVPPDDGYDWIQLTSGEWLKGELVGLFDEEVDFDSEILDDLTLVDTDTDFDLGASMGSLVAAERNTTLTVVIIGTRQSAAALRVSVAHVATTQPVMVVQVGDEPNDDLEALGGRSVHYVAAADLDGFVAEISVRMAAA